MNQHVLKNAKAYASLVGALAAAAMATFGPETTTGQVLTLVAALCAAFVTWRVPNADRP
jgi:hypothetical protein